MGLPGVVGKIGVTFNDVVEMNEDLTSELCRLSLSTGKEGKISQRAKPADAGGGWKIHVANINTLICDLIQPTIEMVRVIGAVASAASARRP